MKKLISILIITSYIILLIPTVSAMGDNLFVNSGFETVSGIKPTEWKTSDSTWSANTVIKSDIVHSGNRSLYISAPTDGNTFVYQRVNVLPETEYTVSFWLYGLNVTSSDMTRMKFEFYKSSEGGAANSLGKDSIIKFDVANNNTWVNLTYTFLTPQDCYMVSVMPRMYSGCKVYVDDFTLYQISEPRYVSLSTDSVFYYSDLTSGNAKVRLNSYYNNLTDLSVDFSIKDGETALAEELGVSFIDSFATYTFPLSILSTLKKEYNIEVSVKNSSGVKLQTEKQAIYKYNRPTAIGKDGLYRIDGIVFQPTFGYHVSQSLYGDAKAAGVNVVQLSYWYADYEADPTRITKALDVCASNNLMALVTLYRDMKPAGDVANKENTKMVVAAIKNHPAVFAYAVMDEPYHQVPDTNNVLRESYKIIRDIDDEHPVYIVDAATECFDQQAKFVDIMGIDPYPRGIKNSATYVAEQTEIAKKAVNYDKPVYVLLQAFLYGDTDSDGVDDYFPTYNEVRHMWYQSLMTGAVAVGYYSFSDTYGSTTPMSQTALWPGITNFAKGEMKFSYDFFKDSQKTLVNEFKDENVWYKRWEKNGESYVAILNQKTVANTVSVDIGKGKLAEVLAGTSEGLVSINDNIITINLEGSAVNIYKIKTDGIVLSKNGLIRQDFDSGNYIVEGAVSGQNGENVTVIVALYNETKGVRDLEYLYVLKSGVIENNKFEFNCDLSIPNSTSLNLMKIIVIDDKAKPYSSTLSYIKIAS